MLDDCELCVKYRNGGVYDFKNTCCRVRLLLNLKLKENVVSWLGFWRRKDGNEIADEIKRQYTEQKLEGEK